MHFKKLMNCSCLWGIAIFFGHPIPQMLANIAHTYTFTTASQKGGHWVCVYTAGMEKVVPQKQKGNNHPLLPCVQSLVSNREFPHQHPNVRLFVCMCTVHVCVCVHVLVYVFVWICLYVFVWIRLCTCLGDDYQSVPTIPPSDDQLSSNV